MLLITTADQRFWKTNKEILFLGEWCKTFSQRATWEKLSGEVLPYHWDNREKVYRDYLYLDTLYEDTLQSLADQLNTIHQVNYSTRYWRIIIGPWLYLFVTVLFDRFQSILLAENSGKVTHSIIGAYENSQWVLRDNLELTRYCTNDVYNQFLFSYIIRERGKFPFNEIPIHSILRDINQAKPSKFAVTASIINFVKECIKKIGPLIPDQLNSIVLISSALPTEDLLHLQIKLGQVPYLLPPSVQLPDNQINSELRKQINLPSSKDEFEQILSKILPQQLPTIYLEGYKEVARNALKTYPRTPGLIFTAVAYEVEESFKFWVAFQTENGTKFVGTQHGSNYGMCKWSQEEDHQIRVCDFYYTWGWTSPTHPHVKSFSTGKFSRIRRQLKSNPQGSLLLTTFAWPRYAYKLYSVPISSSGMQQYLKDQFRFVQALSPLAQQLLLVRLFPNDREWNQMERWQEEFPKINCSEGTKITMADQMNASRLMVTIANGTPCLEALSANFPTVLLWDPNYFELRPSAQPFFQELSRVGILHDNPESAAAKVNEIVDAPSIWWNQLTVQQAKNNFCHQFARTSPTWLEDWCNELLKLKNS